MLVVANNVMKPFWKSSWAFAFQISSEDSPMNIPFSKNWTNYGLLQLLWIYISKPRLLRKDDRLGLIRDRWSDQYSNEKAGSERAIAIPTIGSRDKGSLHCYIHMLCISDCHDPLRAGNLHCKHAIRAYGQKKLIVFQLQLYCSSASSTIIKSQINFPFWNTNQMLRSKMAYSSSLPRTTSWIATDFEYFSAKRLGSSLCSQDLNPKRFSKWGTSIEIWYCFQTNTSQCRLTACSFSSLC